MAHFREFLNDETGAVTVDWVVITSAIVMFGVIAGFMIQPAISELSSEIGIELREAGDDMQAVDPTP
jgi:Flp pilus assembly pilin Flp